MKKTMSIFLAILMLVTMIPFFGITSFAAETEEYIEIYTIEDLYCIRYDMDKNYILMNDIDMTEAVAVGGDWDFGGRGWDPIGSKGVYKNTPFTGIFDGNGYTISGMRITIKGNTDLPSGTGKVYLGLFANVAGTVKNLALENVAFDINTNNVYAGAIAGYADNGATITNCRVESGNINLITGGYSYIGGIVGYSYKANITNCYNNANCTGKTPSDGSLYISGIIGYNDTGTITDCYNTGNLYGNAAYSGYYSSAVYVSGISGYTGTVKNCYNIGKIEGKKVTDASLFLYAISSEKVTNCYYLSGIGGNDTAGANALSEAQMKLQRVYGGFDFENTWYMDSASDYPYPQLRVFAKDEINSIPYTPNVDENGYIKIYTIEDLYCIRYDMDKNYILMNDIDMTEAVAVGGDWDFGGRGWDPIGSEGMYKNTPFTGIFDGNGYTISGMRITINGDTGVPSGTKNSVYLGLFANVAGTVKNLALENVAFDINTYYDVYAGAIAGYADNGATITTCRVESGNINLPTGDYSYIGGIVGYSYGANITNCYNNANCTGGRITAGTLYISGIIGYNDTGTITDCYNTGNLYGNSSFTSGSGSAVYVSGISGGTTGTITNCYNIGIIAGEKLNGARLSLYAISSNEVTNCYYLSGIGGNGTAGTNALSEAQMKFQRVYDGFDFENTWYIDSASDYPYPQLSAFVQHFHRYGDWIVTVEATCVTAGSRYQECNCGDKITEEIAAFGHDFEETFSIDVPATDATEGSKSRHCTRCDEKTDVTVIPVTNHVHTLSNWIIDAEATCTTNGAMHKECTECNKIVEIEKIAKTGHTLSSWIIDTNATCTTDGSKHKECIACKAILEKETIPATIHSFSAWSTVIPASCEKDGIEKRVCSHCGQVEIKYIAGTGHISSNWIVDINSTCTTDGLKHKECTTCKTILKKETISASGHSFNTWSVIIPESCANNGLAKRACSHCGQIELQIISQSEHVESNWIIDNEATCTSNGFKHKECLNCKVILEKEIIAQTGHTEGSLVTVFEPTCSSNGFGIKKCITCNAIIDFETINKTNHSESGWIIDTNATCTADGSKHKECTSCHKTLLTEAIQSTGHSYANGNCLNCGENAPSGWKLENGKWAFYDNGIKVKNQWRKDSQGWCFLDANGYMVTGQSVKDSIGWCLVDGSGYWITSPGWKLVGDTWYYVQSGGYLKTNGWMKDSTGWCFLDPQGRMLKDMAVKDSNGWCLLNANGYWVTGNHTNVKIEKSYNNGLPAGTYNITNGYIVVK